MEGFKSITIKIPHPLWEAAKEAKGSRKIKSISEAAVDGLRSVLNDSLAPTPYFTGERLRRIAKRIKDAGFDIDAAWDAMHIFLVGDQSFDQQKLKGVFLEVFTEEWSPPR